MKYLIAHHFDYSKIFHQYWSCTHTSNSSKFQDRYLFVQFSADHSQQGRGFSAEVSVLENYCGSVLHGTNGTITSPNYPDNYPNEAYCTYELIASSGRQIALHFESINIDGNDDCSSDRIEVFADFRYNYN